MYYVNVSAHTYQWIWWCSVVCRKRWRACMRCLHTICCFSLIATPWHTHNTPSNCITCEQEERIKDMRKSFAYFYTFLSWPIVCSRLTMQAICSSVMEQITSGLSSTKHCNMSSTAAQQDRINTAVSWQTWASILPLTVCQLWYSEQLHQLITSAAGKLLGAVSVATHQCSCETNRQTNTHEYIVHAIRKTDRYANKVTNRLGMTKPTNTNLVN